MNLAYRWISIELGKLEVICSIIILSIVIGIFLNKSLELFVLAERRLLEASVSNIQTALRLQTAIESLNNDISSIKMTAGMNPLVLMQSVPDDYEQYIGSALVSIRAEQFSVKPLSNYLGEMFDPDIELLERGNWYFDRNGNLLIYLVNQNDFFGDNASKLTELRYTVQLDYIDVDNNGYYETGIDKLKSAFLVQIEI